MSVTEKQSEEAGAVERVAHAAREVQSAPKALGGALQCRITWNRKDRGPTDLRRNRGWIVT